MLNKVVCDKCNKEFKIVLKTRKLPEGVEEVYFICQHCKCKYTSYYTDLKIREKQGKINELWKEYRKAKDDKEIVKMVNKINSMKTEIKADMQQLKKKMVN